MTEKDQRLALSYWEGYRWLHVRRESGAEAYHYIEPGSINQCWLLARDFVPLPPGLSVVDHKAEILDGHPADRLVDDNSWRNAPHYPGSLEDCFRIQDKLTREQGLVFADEIRKALNDLHRRDVRWLGPTAFHYINATAKVRTVALLHTLGLWIPSATVTC